MKNNILQRTELDNKKILEENVVSFCPHCGRSVPSKIVEIDNKAFLEKNCCQEKMLVHLENDAKFYMKFRSLTKLNISSTGIENYADMIKKYKDETPVRMLYTTMKCELDCPICFLKFNDLLEARTDFNPEVLTVHDLPLEQIRTILEKYESNLILITGGEPTLRPDLEEIIELVIKSNNFPILLTNGLKLRDKRYVRGLKNAGLRVVYLQFDSFDEKVNLKLRGEELLEARLLALDNLKNEGFQVALTMVVGRSINLEEIPRMIDFACRNNIFINHLALTALTWNGEYSKTTTSPSDLIKCMERYNYFEVDYFFSLIKFYHNIYKIIIKISKNTPLESDIIKKFSYLLSFNTVFFKIKNFKPYLLFPKSEVIDLNKILESALEKEGKLRTALDLIKNTRIILKSNLRYFFRNFLSYRFNFPKTLNLHKGILKISFNSVHSIVNTELAMKKRIGCDPSTFQFTTVD